MWWRLSMPCPPELEESLAWKLNDLGLHRFALQHSPDTPHQKTLLVWLPQPEWPIADREQLLASLEPLSQPFGLAFPSGCWDCLLYTSPSPRDLSTSRMPSSA